MNTQVSSDFAAALRISSISSAHKSQKVRVAGRLIEYSPESALVQLEDTNTSLLVDISLCLSGYASYPWLSERNTVVMAIGYVDTWGTQTEKTSMTPTMILHALVITERRDLDLDVWNSAIDSFNRFKRTIVSGDAAYDNPS